jgi:hypothetical protein
MIVLAADAGIGVNMSGVCWRCNVASGVATPCHPQSLTIFVVAHNCSIFHHRDTIAYTDRRVNAVNEVLTGACVMKLYAWEEAVEETVGQHRAHEFDNISRAAQLKAINLAVSFASSAITSFATFTTYLALNPSIGLDPAIIFTTVAFFGCVRCVRHPLCA